MQARAVSSRFGVIYGWWWGEGVVGRGVAEERRRAGRAARGATRPAGLDIEARAGSRTWARIASESCAAAAGTPARATRRPLRTGARVSVWVTAAATAGCCSRCRDSTSNCEDSFFCCPWPVRRRRSPSRAASAVIGSARQPLPQSFSESGEHQGTVAFRVGSPSPARGQLLSCLSGRKKTLARLNPRPT